MSVWLDDLSRRLLDDGVLPRYIAEHRLSGVTSNSAIFAAAPAVATATTRGSTTSARAARAYERGLATRAACGEPLDRVRSVASVPPVD